MRNLKNDKSFDMSDRNHKHISIKHILIKHIAYDNINILQSKLTWKSLSTPKAANLHFNVECLMTIAMDQPDTQLIVKGKKA